ncbi:hypothetical protein FMEAI12_1810009 [Parafrankia sp. Ea1.12]|nr:hypothetical protein FMEAI12_1810009 [Parafrankia sp. Ea1.12]
MTTGRTPPGWRPPWRRDSATTGFRRRGPGLPVPSARWRRARSRRSHPRRRRSRSRLPPPGWARSFPALNRLAWNLRALDPRVWIRWARDLRVRRWWAWSSQARNPRAWCRRGRSRLGRCGRRGPCPRSRSAPGAATRPGPGHFGAGPRHGRRPRWDLLVGSLATEALKRAYAHHGRVVAAHYFTLCVRHPRSFPGHTLARRSRCPRTDPSGGTEPVRWRPGRAARARPALPLNCATA